MTQFYKQNCNNQASQENRSKKIKLNNKKIKLRIYSREVDWDHFLLPGKTLSHPDRKSKLDNLDFLSGWERVFPGNKKWSQSTSLIAKQHKEQLTGDRQNFVASKYYFIDLFEKYLDCLFRLSDYEIYSCQIDIRNQIAQLKNFQRKCEDLSQKYPVQEILFYLTIMIQIQEINLEIYIKKYDYLQETLTLISALFKLGYYGFKISLSDAGKEAFAIGNKLYKKIKNYSSKQIFNALISIDLLRIEYLAQKQNISKEENIYKEDKSKCFDNQFKGIEGREILFYISLVVNEETNMKYLKNQNELQLIYILNKIDYLLTINFLQSHQKDSLIQFCSNQNVEFNLTENQVLKFIEYICNLYYNEFNEILLLFSDSEIHKLKIVYVITSLMIKLFKIFSIKKKDEKGEIVYLEDKSNSILQNLWHHICYIYLTTKRKEILTIFNFSCNNFCGFLSEYLDSQQNIVLLQQKFNISLNVEQNYVEKLLNLWEWYVFERKEQGLEQKDDLLHDVKDIYVNQRFKYLKGNNIFLEALKEKGLTIINPTKLVQQTSNNIMRNYFSNRRQNFEISPTTKMIQQYFLQQTDCFILVILADEGIGKSMLLKKLQIDLTCDSSKQFFPILIKCSQFNSKCPNIEDILTSDEYSINYFDLLKIKKSTNRKKVILLDGYDEYIGENFNIFTDLNLSEWKNTKVILTSRKQKLDESSIVQFIQFKDENKNLQNSFCILDLLQFSNEEILDYCQKFSQKQSYILLKRDESNYEYDQINNCLISKLQRILEYQNIKNLLVTPIYLYMLTRIVIQLNQNQIIKIQSIDQDFLEKFFFDLKKQPQNMKEALIQFEKIMI